VTELTPEAVGTGAGEMEPRKVGGVTWRVYWKYLQVCYALHSGWIDRSGATVARLLCDPSPYKNVLKYRTGERSVRNSV
jgi:hypothetical protein